MECFAPPSPSTTHQEKVQCQLRQETRTLWSVTFDLLPKTRRTATATGAAGTPLSAAAEGPRWRGRASASSGYDWWPDCPIRVPSLRASWRFIPGFTPYEWTPVNAQRSRVHSRCRNGDGRVHDAVLVEQQRCLSASTAAAVALLPPLPWRHFVWPLGLPRRPGTKCKLASQSVRALLPTDGTCVQHHALRTCSEGDEDRAVRVVGAWLVPGLSGTCRVHVHPS